MNHGANMSFVDQNLIPGEQVLYRTRIHWMTRVHGSTFLFYLALLVWPLVYLLKRAGMLSPQNFEWVAPPGGVAILVLLALACVPPLLIWLAVASTEFAVTTHRVVFKTGLMGRHSLELHLSKVESIAVQQGILGRVFGYGTLVVIGTGGTREPFQGVARPLEFRRAVTEATERTHTRAAAAPAPA